MSIASLFRALLDRKFLFTFFALGLAAIGATYTFIVTPIYQSQALLMVSESSGPTVARDGVSATSTPEALKLRLNTYLHVLHSDEVLRPVIQKVGAQRLFPEIGTSRSAADASWLANAAVSIARSKIVVSAEKDSQVIAVTFRHPDPNLAREVVAELTEKFRDRLAILNGSAAGVDFYVEQQRRYLALHEEATQRLAQFAEANSTYALKQEAVLTVQRRNEILTALTGTRGIIADKESQAATLQATLAQLRQRIAVPGEVVGPKYNATPGPDIFGTNKIPANESPLLLVKVFQETAQVLVVLNASVAGARALEKSQSAALADIEETLNRFGAISSVFERLQGEVEQTANMLAMFRKQGAEARLDADRDGNPGVAPVKLLQAASSPLRAVFPQKALFLLLSAFIGVLGATSVIAMMELVRAHRSIPSAGLRPEFFDHSKKHVPRFSDSLDPTNKPRRVSAS